MSELTTPSPVLAYADLPARMGIQYEVREGQVSIVLPSTPIWQRAEVIVPVLLIPLWPGVGLVGSVATRDVGGIIVYAIVAVGLLIGAVMAARIRRPVKFVLNAHTLHLEHVRPLWTGDTRPVRTMTYARAGVYDVHFVSDTGNIIIRIRGQEMVEIKPSGNREIDEWIAAELRRALGLPA